MIKIQDYSDCAPIGGTLPFYDWLQRSRLLAQEFDAKYTTPTPHPSPFFSPSPVDVSAFRAALKKESRGRVECDGVGGEWGEYHSWWMNRKLTLMGLKANFSLGLNPKLEVLCTYFALVSGHLVSVLLQTANKTV